MTRSAALVTLWLVACGGEVAPESTPAPEPTRAPIPIECQSAPAALTAYDAITDGAAFSLEIMRDERGAWLPTSPLSMPLHHASMISWNDAEHLLDAHTSREPIVVFATGVGTPAIEHDETRGVFFAMYTARVDRVCPATD